MKMILKKLADWAMVPQVYRRGWVLAPIGALILVIGLAFWKASQMKVVE